MNHWLFVIAAYAVTLVGVAALIIRSALAMRRWERAADAVKRR